MDFMMDTLADARKFRTLNIIDDFTRECLAIEVDTSLPGARVVQVLTRLAESRGWPEVHVVDNGPEFAGRALDTWAFQHGVRLHFIQPGKPVQNAVVESFNEMDSPMEIAHPTLEGRDRMLPDDRRGTWPDICGRRLP